MHLSDAATDIATALQNLPMIDPNTGAVTPAEPQISDITPTASYGMFPALTSSPTPSLTTPSSALNYQPSPITIQSIPTAPPPATNTDWFTRNVVPLVQAGLTTYAAVNQIQAAQSQLPAGVSPSYLPIARPTLTSAQLAQMTPAQQTAYYQTGTVYPTSQPSLMSSLGLGTMDPTTMLLLGGGSLLIMILMMRRSK